MYLYVFNPKGTNARVLGRGGCTAKYVNQQTGHRRQQLTSSSVAVNLLNTFEPTVFLQLLSEFII